MRTLLLSIVVICAVAPRPELLADEAATASAVPATATDREIAKWNRLTQQKPNQTMPWAHLGNALMQKSREAKPGDLYDRAEAAFRQALALDGENVEATVGMAWVFNSRHEFDQGVQWAKKAIALDDDNQDAYALLADAAVERGDYDQALEHCQKCLDIAPNLASYSRAAHVLFLQGDARMARWLMQKAIDAGGPYAENTAWCRAQLALMLFDAGALPLAETQLQRALESTPDNRHVLAAMAKVKTAKKEYDAAIEYCRKSSAVMRDHDVLVMLGDLYTLVGKESEADEQYRQVIRLQGGHDHGDGQFHTHGSDRGNALLARFLADHDRDLPEALRQAEKAYETEKNVFVADTLAWCYYKNGRYGEARKAIEESLRHQTPKAEILFHAGMIHAKLGDRAKAQKYLYQALSLNPYFHHSHAELAARTIAELSAREETRTYE